MASIDSLSPNLLWEKQLLLPGSLMAHWAMLVYEVLDLIWPFNNNHSKTKCASDLTCLSTKYLCKSYICHISISPMTRVKSNPGKLHTLGGERSYIITVCRHYTAQMPSPSSQKCDSDKTPQGRQDLNEHRDDISSQSLSPWCCTNLPAEVQQSMHWKTKSTQEPLVDFSYWSVRALWKHTSCAMLQVPNPPSKEDESFYAHHNQFLNDGYYMIEL